MLAQQIFKSIINNRMTSRSDRFRYWAASKMRRLLLRFFDPLVRYRIGEIPLHIPLSNELPISIHRHPRCNTNIARLAKYTRAKYPNLSIIDIGANIGDSVAYIRSEIDVPILCLEGNPHFFPILQKNIESLPKVFAQQVFVGHKDERLNASVGEERGTSRIAMAGTTPTEISTASLETILEAWPTFQGAKFIKIDTDGFDVPIILGALAFLARNKPVVFFEYDPNYFIPLGEDGLSVFTDLVNVGYTSALIYDNCGDFLRLDDLDDRRSLEDMHNYFLGWNSTRYADIAVFSAEDSDLAVSSRIREQAFYSSVRGKQ